MLLPFKDEEMHLKELKDLNNEYFDGFLIILMKENKH